MFFPLLSGFGWSFLNPQVFFYRNSRHVHGSHNLHLKISFSFHLVRDRKLSLVKIFSAKKFFSPPHQNCFDASVRFHKISTLVCTISVSRFPYKHVKRWFTFKDDYLRLISNPNSALSDTLKLCFIVIQ